ncbi:unnamed protein product [Cuscuta europaea]|uniref:Uncharacterized protein n=1 Tax=Cuscuta europaea TaxID=41803 RepID=A0A9P1A3E5_CUSEU|nr:unnamed protein product [Cuscuta europaea]
MQAAAQEEADFTAAVAAPVAMEQGSDDADLATTIAASVAMEQGLGGTVGATASKVLGPQSLGEERAFAHMSPPRCESTEDEEPVFERGRWREGASSAVGEVDPAKVEVEPVKIKVDLAKVDFCNQVQPLASSSGTPNIFSLLDLAQDSMRLKTQPSAGVQCVGPSPSGSSSSSRVSEDIDGASGGATGNEDTQQGTAATQDDNAAVTPDVAGNAKSNPSPDVVIEDATDEGDDDKDNETFQQLQSRLHSDNPGPSGAASVGEGCDPPHGSASGRKKCSVARGGGLPHDSV